MNRSNINRMIVSNISWFIEKDLKRPLVLPLGDGLVLYCWDPSSDAYL